ncbi:MAG: DUF2034 domain-containing protein [Denitromonas halophila]|nr:MAG: DUF2034 domain-containing protein [Denitromonas halophila]TVT70526.1 MAG: DUF2034 domain-containing protein [Denitromonas halophila]
MARRRRKSKDSPLDLALASDWRFSAVMAGVCFFGPRILSAILDTSPLLKGLGTAFSMIGTVLAAVFGAIAVIKLGKQLLKPRPLPEWPSLSPADRQILKGTPRSEPSIRVAPRGPVPTPAATPEAWSIDVLHRIEWKRFEDLCCAFYVEKGIRARTTALGPDGGVDIHLFQDDAAPSQATAIVQCKAHNSRIGVKPIRELRGVMAHEKVDKAFFMAPGGFTDEARAFATEHRITLLDAKLFYAMIARLPAESRQRLLALATDGDWTTPTCPNCGKKLVARNSKRGPLWGCPSYPRCKGMIPMRQSDAASPALEIPK